jgi:serine/threonine protein kinase
VDRIGDYQFDHSLGEGSTGFFYVAAPPPRLGIDDPLVVVKVLKIGAGDQAFHRMTRELRTFARVHSDHLVMLYDAGQEAGTLYYAMEYFPMGSLAKPTQPLDRSQILSALSDTARAAHDLHEAGMAHRNIKPTNVMITETGGKLADLGMVQVLAPGQTITGMGGMDSIEYVDPAIIRGERASRSSDIWTIGVTLHWALTGKSVYGDLPDGDPLLAVRRVLTTPPALSPDLPPGEAALIQSCLDPNPGDRPRTAAELADLIDALAVKA